MIYMQGGRNRKFRPLFLPVGAGVQPHRGHAHGMGLHQIARDVIEHGGCAGRKAAMRHDAAIGQGVGLGRKADGADVPDIVKQITQSQPRQDSCGMPGAAIGEDVAAARQTRDGEGQGAIVASGR